MRSSSESEAPRIGITVGDPAGIGPEVSLKAAFRPEVLDLCAPVLIGEATSLVGWACRLGLPDVMRILSPEEAIPRGVGAPFIFPLPLPANALSSLELGKEQALGGQAAAAAIETAVELCRAGRLDAMATAPINKKSLALAGYPFPGHTEFLAHLTGCDDFAMTFISPKLKVALLTTHVPLREVHRYVKQRDLERLIRLIDRELRKFGWARPRIALAALNPHGGEGGLFGEEESLEMRPAIDRCRAESIDVSGPHPGDTVFVRAARGEFDLVISCYHDQGLIPIKCFSFGEAVNVSLGLPIIRTSVDHGTAFDIAGRGIADESSMIAAIKLAAELVLKSR